LKVGTLGYQDILVDVGFGLDYRKSIQGRVVGNRYRRIQIDDIKNTLEVFFTVFHKINEQSLRRPIRPEIDVWIQFARGMVV